MTVAALVWVGAIVWYARNTAKSAAQWVPAFAADSGAQVYCGNGYGKGVDNQISWWEWTVLGEGSPAVFADELTEALTANGFDPITVSRGTPDDYAERSRSYPDSAEYASSWIRLDASNASGISLTARVADAITPNSCFAQDDDVLIDADPSQAEVVAVLRFRD